MKAYQRFFESHDNDDDDFEAKLKITKSSKFKSYIHNLMSDRGTPSSKYDDTVSNFLGNHSLKDIKKLIGVK